MIETTIRNYLKTKLSPLAVYLDIPADPDEEYVTIEKVGSGRENHINEATIALQSVAGSLYKAASINEDVKEAMDELAVLDDICCSNLNSDYNFTDTKTKKYRYQAVYDIKHY